VAWTNLFVRVWNAGRNTNAGIEGLVTRCWLLFF